MPEIEFTPPPEPKPIDYDKAYETYQQSVSKPRREQAERARKILADKLNCDVDDIKISSGFLSESSLLMVNITDENPIRGWDDDRLYFVKTVLKWGDYDTDS